MFHDDVALDNRISTRTDGDEVRPTSHHDVRASANRSVELSQWRSEHGKAEEKVDAEPSIDNDNEAR